MGNITVTATSPSTVAPVSTSLLSFDGTVASVFHNTRPSAAYNDHKLGRRSQSCGDESSEKVDRSPSEKGRIQQSQLTTKEATKLGSISSSSSHVVKSVFVQGVGWASQVSSNRNIRTAPGVTNQNQISPDNVNTFLRKKVIRINKMVTKEKYF